jgi:hypothetical protein
MKWALMRQFIHKLTVYYENMRNRFSRLIAAGGAGREKKRKGKIGDNMLILCML